MTWRFIESSSIEIDRLRDCRFEKSRSVSTTLYVDRLSANNTYHIFLRTSSAKLNRHRTSMSNDIYTIDCEYSILKQSQLKCQAFLSNWFLLREELVSVTYRALSSSFSRCDFHRCIIGKSVSVIIIGVFSSPQVLSSSSLSN